MWLIEVSTSKKNTTILSHNLFPRFFLVVSSLVNAFYMMYCNEVEQSNAGCNEIKLNIVAKLQNISRGEQIKEKKVK